MTKKQTHSPILDDLPTGRDALDFQPYADAWRISFSTRTPTRR